jgi:Na+/H+ antiporter NhaD/arsenite permease-like protein
LVSVASAILDNVTTILLAVPMTFLIADKLRVNPIPFILGEVFVSNIGGAATLIGDPPNIIIASKAGLDFNEFLLHMAPLCVAALAVVIPMMLFFFRTQLTNTVEDRAEVLKLIPASFISDRKLMVKSLAVLTIVIVGFILHTVMHLEPSLIAMMGAGLLVLISGLKPAEFAMDVEWGTLVFFAGLFIMVGALVNVGALNILAETLADFVGDDSRLAAGALVLASALVSGIVDNIPYVASMIPVVQHLVEVLPPSGNDGLWWALAFGADFGGNLTIIGASANVVAIGLAHARGIRISFWYFFRYGLPVTVVSVGMALPYVLFRYF